MEGYDPARSPPLANPSLPERVNHDVVTQWYSSRYKSRKQPLLHRRGNRKER